jgi:hypothetical protein
VGGSDNGGIVAHMLLWEGAKLGELWCTCCYCGKEQYLRNCGAYGVSVGGRKFGGNALHILLLWKGAILGELWCTCYCEREQYWGNCGTNVVIVGGNNIGELWCNFFTLGGPKIGGIVVHIVLLWEGAILGEFLCTLCDCGKEQYWGNFGEHGVTLGRSDIVGFVVHMVLR